MGKGFKRAMAVVALIMMVGFSVCWILYLTSPSLREGNFYMLPLFLGGFGVLMFVGIRLYNPPGMDGDTADKSGEQEPEHGQEVVETADTQSKENND